MLVSVWLDSELSEFELAMMRAHLLSCPSCAAHADNTVALTGMLRLRPLEPLPCPVFIPHRQRGGWRVISASVAVAAIVAAIGVGLGTTPFSTSHALRGSLPATHQRSYGHPSPIDDRANWAGGLPRVTPTELPVPLGQRQVSTDT
jgi:anti-sigma factor RsiW